MSDKPASPGILKTRWKRVVVALVATTILLTVSACVVLLNVAREINQEIDRCSDQSHHDYIWDDAMRQAACERDKAPPL